MTCDNSRKPSSSFWDEKPLMRDTPRLSFLREFDRQSTLFGPGRRTGHGALVLDAADEFVGRKSYQGTDFQREVGSPRSSLGTRIPA